MIPIQFIMEMENIAPQRMKERYRIHYANTFLKRTFGLMFRKDFLGLMVFCFPELCTIIVHTFFMKFNIRTRFYNNNKIIKECNMNPWRVMVVRNVDCFTEEKR